MLPGVLMRRIGWAIALAAAWLTPAAAQAPASSPAVTAPAAAQQTAAPTAGTAQTSTKPDTATPSQAAIPTIAPTPGIGQPDGRMGLQTQVGPIGHEAAGFHDNILLPLCAIISAIVLILLLVALVRFRRGGNPVPSRNSHN